MSTPHCECDMCTQLREAKRNQDYREQLAVVAETLLPARPRTFCTFCGIESQYAEQDSAHHCYDCNEARR